MFVPRAGDQETLTASVLLGPPLVDVQRRPHQAALFLEESDGHQGNDAVATKQSLLLGASGQVGGSADVNVLSGKDGGGNLSAPRRLHLVVPTR